jgi:hypothetical protein
LMSMILFSLFLSRCINKGKIEAQPQMCLRHFINGVLQPFPSQFSNLPPAPPYSAPSGDQAHVASSAACGEPPVSSQAAPAQSSEVCSLPAASYLCFLRTDTFVSFVWHLA